MIYRSVNPLTEQEAARFDLHDDAEVDRALDEAASAFVDWRRRPIAERCSLLRSVGDLLEREAPSLAGLMAEEMGKPIAQGRAEAAKCAWGCRFYADHAEPWLQPEPRESDGSEAELRYEPLGAVLAIMPWNFPFWQFFRFAAPALAVGNTVLLKHAPNTPRCATTIEALLHRAGLPAGVVRNLFLSNEQAARVIADDRVRGVTLTGSTRAGRQVARAAGAALKPAVMELGGSDPFIVFDDADVDLAVRVGAEARCLNNGQSCIAAKRFFVHRSVAEWFEAGFVAEMSARRLGDPTDPDVDIGPLARADLRDRLADQVERSIAAGAKVLCGGRLPVGRGFFYPPTVLSEVDEASPAANEELFGPVATLTVFDGEAEALRLSNDSRYGLGASLWTRDPQRARRLIAEIESGSVFVNGLVKSDPRLPFGGVKDSGFGRELSREGMLEFVNAKTVWIA